MNEIFVSERQFTLYDYDHGNKQLLLQSRDTEEFTGLIKIVFFDIDYMQLFFWFEGVKIRLVNDQSDIVAYEVVRELLKDGNKHIFEIKSKNSKYYVVASSLKVTEG